MLDLHLPKIHGVEVLKKIKSHRWIQHVSAIVFICSGGHPNIKKYDALGADGYILKPLNFGNFAGAIVNLGFHWSLLAYSAIIAESYKKLIRKNEGCCDIFLGKQTK